MSEEYLRQMRELERQEQGLTSQYTNEKKMDSNDYRSIVNAGLDYAPVTGENWAQYADRISIYAKINAEKNRLTHIDGPHKAWYTHRSPQKCFMCEDTNLIACMRRVIGLMAIQYPKQRF